MSADAPLNFAAIYPPTAVTDVAGTLAVDTNVLTLTWSEPSDVGSSTLKTYNVDQVNTETAEVIQSKTVEIEGDDLATTVDFEDIQAATAYKFHVVATNDDDA